MNLLEEFILTNDFKTILSILIYLSETKYTLIVKCRSSRFIERETLNIDYTDFLGLLKKKKNQIEIARCYGFKIYHIKTSFENHLPENERELLNISNQICIDIFSKPFLPEPEKQNKYIGIKKIT